MMKTILEKTSENGIFDNLLTLVDEANVDTLLNLDQVTF